MNFTLIDRSFKASALFLRNFGTVITVLCKFAKFVLFPNNLEVFVHFYILRISLHFSLFFCSSFCYSFLVCTQFSRYFVYFTSFLHNFTVSRHFMYCILCILNNFVVVSLVLNKLYIILQIFLFDFL